MWPWAWSFWLIFTTLALANDVLHAFAFPVRINRFPKFLDFLLFHKKAVLRPGGQRFKFPVDPGAAGFGKHDAVADAFGPVSHDKLFGFDADFQLFERGLQGEGPFFRNRKFLVFLINSRNDARLFDGRETGRGKHFFFQDFDAGIEWMVFWHRRPPFLYFYYTLFVIVFKIVFIVFYCFTAKKSPFPRNGRFSFLYFCSANICVDK